MRTGKTTTKRKYFLDYFMPLVNFQSTEMVVASFLSSFLVAVWGGNLPITSFSQSQTLVLLSIPFNIAFKFFTPCLTLLLVF